MPALAPVTIATLPDRSGRAAPAASGAVVTTRVLRSHVPPEVELPVDGAHHAVLGERGHERAVTREYRTVPEDAPVTRIGRLVHEQEPVPDITMVVEVRRVGD